LFIVVVAVTVGLTDGIGTAVGRLEPASGRYEFDCVPPKGTIFSSPRPFLARIFSSFIIFFISFLSALIILLARIILHFSQFISLRSDIAPFVM